MAYLFGAGLTLIVLLAALPLLSAEGKPSAETDPVESLEPTWPSETAAPTKPTQPGPDCPEALRELLKRNQRPMTLWQDIRGPMTSTPI